MSVATIPIVLLYQSRQFKVSLVFFTCFKLCGRELNNGLAADGGPDQQLC